MSTSALVTHNIAYLRQALGLLNDLEEAAYQECRPPFFSSGIGDHMRHIIEHYQCFVAGLPTGRVNYDARQRNLKLSSDTAYARDQIESLIEQMTAVSEADRAVSVRLDGSATAGDADPWSKSTVRRELQYLQAHTVHHYALIAFILRLQGQEPGPDFGVAPSTLRFRRQTASGETGT